ncbi:nuclease PIN [Escherichia coli]|nr:nuclease PIN [Escherichia coli]EFM9887603.1 nuclease PIN [Escherichia coli]EIP1031095.1 nuclease PIN [Escherichia coli]
MRLLFLFLSMSMCGFSHANDRYCNILWMNDYKPSVQPFHVNVDGNASLSTPMSINVGGISTAIKSASALKDTGNIPISGHIRYWFQFPTDWQTTSEGLRFKISSIHDDADVQIPGVRTVVTPIFKMTWPHFWGCSAPEEKYTFIKNTQEGFQLEIDRASAFPGKYNIQLPIKAGYEENKGDYQGENGNGWKEYAAAMASFPVIDSSGVEIEIRSACTISARNIDINMGAIKASDAMAGVRKKVPVSVMCSSPARVKLELSGNDFVDGVKNKINCGNGSCTLSFSSGKSDETLVFHQQGTQTVNIESLFKVNGISSGEFSGSAVLKMNVL